MKKIMAVMIIFLCCGKEPPEPPWEPSSEDTIAIRSLLDENKELFEVLGFLGDTVEIGSDLKGTLHKYVENDTLRERYIPFRFFRSLKELVQHKDTIIVSPFDTTLQVRITDSLTAVAKIYLDEVYRKGDTTSTSIDTLFEKDFIGVVWQEAFFERDEENNWYLSKITGGAEMNVPNFSDAPWIRMVIFKHSAGVDTVNFVPDTLTYGVRRLYSLDSLITIKAKDSVEISVYWVWADEDMGFNVVDTVVKYFIVEGKRFLYPEVKKFAFTQTGIQRIYFEAILYHVFVFPNEVWKETMWAIPIKVE